MLLMLIVGGLSRSWRLVRRSRMLLLAMLLVYAFSTPGTALIPGWEQANPTQEGLIIGAYQVWRLLLMITALAALLAFLTRQQLLAGIYQLLLPLNYLGVPVTRFSVRLWLTLHYLETAPKMESLNTHWDSLLQIPENHETIINMDVPKFGLSDILFCLVYFVLLGSALCLG